MVLDAIGDTYAGLLEHSLKKSTEEDSIYVLEEGINTLFELIDSGPSNQQQGAALSILKIIKVAPSNHFDKIVPTIIEGLVECLNKKKLSAIQTCLECIMSIVIYSDKDVSSYIESILGILIEHVCSSNPLVRKAALDTINSLCVVCPDEMRYYKEEMIETIKVVKSDSDKRVIEAAHEAMQAVRSLSSEEGSNNVIPPVHDNKSQSNQAKATTNKQIHTREKSPLNNNEKNIGKASGEEAIQKKSRREYGINKKLMNPNFKRSGSDQIEIFVNGNQKTPIQSPTVLPVNIKGQDMISQPFNDNDRNSHFMDRESTIVDKQYENDEMENKMERFGKSSRERDDGTKKPLPNNNPFEEHNLMKKNMFKDDGEEMEGREVVRRERNRLDTHKFIEESENVGENQFNKMDEERKYRPSPPPVPPRTEDRQRLRTPDHQNEYTRQRMDRSSKRRVHTEEYFADQVSEGMDVFDNHKIVKTNNYEVDELRKVCDGLKKDNTAQMKIIDHQNKRIDSLVNHVQSMTHHMNQLLSKVNLLEQNVFQISNSRSQPQQIIIPPFNYPISTPVHSGQVPQMGMFHPQQQMLPHQYGYQQPAIHTINTNSNDMSQISHNRWKQQDNNIGSGNATKENQWKKKTTDKDINNKGYRDEGIEKSKRKAQVRVDSIPLDARDTLEENRRVRDNQNARQNNRQGVGEMELEREKEEVLEDEDEESSHIHQEDAMDTGINKRVTDLKTHKYPDKHIISDGDGEGFYLNRPDENGEEEDQLVESTEKSKEVNEALGYVLGKDNRKLLDFLSDFDNLSHFHLLNIKGVNSLLIKLTELLASRIETNVSIVLPWIDQYIQYSRFNTKDDIKGLLHGVKVILSGNKSSKQYQQNTLERLDMIRQDLEKLM